MNVPDLSRRAAISDKQKSQAQAADMGLWLKIAVDCCVKGFAVEGALLEVCTRRAFDAADAFMAEYKKRSEENSKIPEGWRIVRDGQGWEAIGPKTSSWAESMDVVVKWAISEAEKERAQG